MNIQPSIDLKKVNLQSAVGYLISLHDNEVDWNLLGIKVIGHIDALPIPEGTYEYGDAYMVGTETPYDMYIYSRPDGAVHTEGYWFPIGKFPMPGPQGPKGDGLEQISNWINGSVSNVTYDTTDGAKVRQTTTVAYKDSDDGSTKYKSFGTTTTLPIVPGKYISMDATSDNNKMEVKVDDTALELDYIKINKTGQSLIPRLVNGVVYWTDASDSVIKNAIAQRDGNGDCSFRNIKINSMSTDGSSEKIYYPNLYYNCTSAGDLEFSKRPNDTGTIAQQYLDRLQTNIQMHITYENKVYYRMSPINAPDDTLNYVHIDLIQGGNGGYKATGKCFSITVSTRAFQVFDLDFGGSTYKHVTQMHVVIPGDDDYYLTIFNTDKHGAMYNLNSASTLLDNIGTAGTIAYKQNTANGVYMPVHVSKNPSGNWAWNMGSASGTFTTNQIDLITDDYETIV